MKALLLLFITLPILEMWVLIEVGSRIGALPTIALVFLTAIIGLALLRQQGLNTLLRVNQRMAEGQLPAEEILEGVMLAVGGALLLTPGFITDTIGFACLIPATRKMLARTLLKHSIVSSSYDRGTTIDGTTIDGTTNSTSDGTTGYTETHYTQYRSSRVERDKNFSDGDTIDGEFRRDD